MHGLIRTNLGQLGKTGLYGFNDTLICATSYSSMYDQDLFIQR